MLPMEYVGSQVKVCATPHLPQVLLYHVIVLCTVVDAVCGTTTKTSTHEDS